MAVRLYTGLVHKQLRGNREDALTLEREARTKVGYLFDAMRPGETFKTGSWSLLGGRRIMAFVWNDVLGKRAIMRLTGVSEVTGETVVYWMHHGFYAANQKVYVPIDIAAYTTRLGKIEITDEILTPSSMLLPELGDENEYTPADLIGIPIPGTVDAYRSSGLGVAFWQARNGAGLFAEGLPDSSWVAPERTALIRSPYDQYWLIRLVGEISLEAIHMVVPSPLLGFAGQVRTTTGIEQRVIQSFVLGYLEWDKADPLILADETALTAIFDKNAHDPFNWGIQWSWQEFGADDELDPHAVFTVWRQCIDDNIVCNSVGTIGSAARTCTITINWDLVTQKPEDVSIIVSESLFRLNRLLVSMSLAVDDEYSWAWGQGGSLNKWRAERFDTYPYDPSGRVDNAVICSWFKYSGELFTVVWNGWGMVDSGFPDYVLVYTGNMTIDGISFTWENEKKALFFSAAPRGLYVYYSFYIITTPRTTGCDFDFHAENADIFSGSLESHYGDGALPPALEDLWILNISTREPGESANGFAHPITNQSSGGNIIYDITPISYAWEYNIILCSSWSSVPLVCSHKVGYNDNMLSSDNYVSMIPDGNNGADYYSSSWWNKFNHGVWLGAA